MGVTVMEHMSRYVWKHVVCTCKCYHEVEVCVQNPLAGVNKLQAYFCLFWS